MEERPLTAVSEPMSGAEWDARAEFAVAIAIRRFMADHPAPADAQTALDLAAWGENLRRDGLARLAARAVPHLHVVQ